MDILLARLRGFGARRALCVVFAMLVVVSAKAFGGEECGGARMVLLSEARSIVDANRPIRLEVSDTQVQRFRESLYHHSDFSGEIGELLRVPGKMHAPPDSDSEGSPGDWEVSPEQAAEEVELLFTALRFGYAGYQFFGGDAAFGAAREAILREVAELASYYDAIPNWRYRDAVVRHLDFVHDSHLVFGSRSLCERVHFRFCPYYEFRLSADGYYHDLDGRRLVAVNSESPSGYLKPSINADGYIVYILGVASSERQQATLLELEFEGGIIDMAWLMPADGMNYDSGKAYELTTLDGLPMAVCRTFGVSPETAEDLADFVRDAQVLRRVDVALLDLRSNPGGAIWYGQEFCRSLAVTDPGPFIMTANLITDTALALQTNQQAEAGDVTDWFMRIRDERHRLEDPELPGWIVSVSPGVYAQNTPFMLVLMDGGTASAAEALIRSLRSMDNVVLIGVNTGGALLTGNAGLLRLPYSGLAARIPTMIWMDAELRNMDGIGYFPDFWVYPDAAENAAAFARRYLVKRVPER